MYWSQGRRGWGGLQSIGLTCEAAASSAAMCVGVVGGVGVHMCVLFVLVCVHVCDGECVCNNTVGIWRGMFEC